MVSTKNRRLNSVLFAISPKSGIACAPMKMVRQALDESTGFKTVRVDLTHGARRSIDQEAPG